MYTTIKATADIGFLHYLLRLLRGNISSEPLTVGTTPEDMKTKRQMDSEHLEAHLTPETDVLVTFENVDSVTQNYLKRSDKRQSDVTSKGQENAGTESEAMQIDDTSSDTDTDTIILDSDEDLDVVQKDELIYPPPEILSPLKASFDKPPLRNKPDVESRSEDLPDSDETNLFKVPQIPVTKAKPRFEAFLKVPEQHPDERIVASAGSDLFSFRSHQRAPVPVLQSREQSEPIKRVRRYNSEPYRPSRHRRHRGTWRTIVLVRKSSPRRYVPQNVTTHNVHSNGKPHGNRDISHIWFKSGISHPLLTMDSNHMPKFLRRRVQRQKELENKWSNDHDAKQPCFHCGCPGNHMPKFMKKRLLRKLKTTTDLDSILMKEVTLLQDVPIENMRIEEGDLKVENDSSGSGSEDDLETSINQMRKRLLKRQSRMEVLERVMYKKKSKGVFVASLMSPKHWMLRPKRR